jgi:hypothetical protein
MSLRQRFSLLAVCLCMTFALVACKPEHLLPTLNRASPMAVVPISLDVDSAGFCTQNGVENGSVAMGAPGVSWYNPNGYTVEVHFAAGCGLGNGCDYSAVANPQSGKSAWAGPAPLPYTTILINNKQCTVGSDGLIMR